MINRKKALAVLAVTIACGMAVSCSKVGNKSSGEPTEITWYMMKSNSNMSSQEEVEKAVNKSLIDRHNLKLKLKLVDSGSWKEKINVVISSGEEYDVCFTSSWTNSFTENLRRNAFADISKYLDEYGSDIRKKVDSRAWEAVTVDGKIYGIPSQTPYIRQNSFVFKKDLVDKYNFDYKSVKCLKDLEPYLEILKKNEPDIIPLAISASMDLTEPYEGYTSVLDCNFMKYSEAEDRLVENFDLRLDEYRTRYEYYKKGYIAKDAFTRKDKNEGKTGKYAVMSDSGAYTEDASKSSAYYGFPCYETLVYQQSNIDDGAFIAMANAVSITSKHPDKAVQLLNEVWKDPEISNTLAYGIEGIDYKVVSGKGTPEMSIEPKEGAQATWGIAHNIIGPLWDQWDSSWNRLDALNAMRKLNEETPVSGSLGFKFDPTPVKSEIAAINEVTTGTNLVFKTGSMEDFDSYVKEYRAKRDSAGFRKVVAEANRQFEEWKKTRGKK